MDSASSELYHPCRLVATYGIQCETWRQTWSLRACSRVCCSLAVSCFEFADAHAHSSQDERKSHHGCERESSSRDYGVARCGSVGEPSHAHTHQHHTNCSCEQSPREPWPLRMIIEPRRVLLPSAHCSLLFLLFPPTRCREDTLRHFGRHREGGLPLQANRI